MGELGGMGEEEMCKICRMAVDKMRCVGGISFFNSRRCFFFLQLL
jgi:hypothetical protein